MLASICLTYRNQFAELLEVERIGSGSTHEEHLERSEKCEEKRQIALRAQHVHNAAVDVEWGWECDGTEAKQLLDSTRLAPAGSRGARDR